MVREQVSVDSRLMERFAAEYINGLCNEAQQTIEIDYDPNVKAITVDYAVAETYVNDIISLAMKSATEEYAEFYQNKNIQQETKVIA